MGIFDILKPRTAELPIQMTLKAVQKIRKGRSLGIIDNVFRDKVHPVKGSIVCCDLGFLNIGVEHSGVYVGDGKIVHRDGGGYLDIVPPKTFLERFDGINGAISVYVSCCGTEAVGSKEVAKRARRALKNPNFEGYNLLTNNCHLFCQYCLTNDDPGLLDFTFASLEKTLEEEYGFDNWRVWDIDIY